MASLSGRKKDLKNNLPVPKAHFMKKIKTAMTKCNIGLCRIVG